MTAIVPPQQDNPMLLPSVNHAGKLRVLLVVDTRDEAQDIRNSLHEHCFVEIQMDAEQAYSFYRPRFYDLVIIDYKTYKMDSYQFYLNLRKVDQTTKVCLITTDNATKAPEKTVMVLRKPFDKATLIATISKLLEE
jgi:DNA-binding NtrC family response regulator